MLNDKDLDTLAKILNGLYGTLDDRPYRADDENNDGVTTRIIYEDQAGVVREMDTLRALSMCGNRIIDYLKHYTDLKSKLAEIEMRLFGDEDKAMETPVLDNSYIDDMVEQNTIDMLIFQIREYARDLGIEDQHEFMQAYKHCITVWDFADFHVKGEVVNFIREALNKTMLSAFMEITATKSL